MTTDGKTLFREDYEILKITGPHATCDACGEQLPMPSDAYLSGPDTDLAHRICPSCYEQLPRRDSQPVEWESPLPEFPKFFLPTCPCWAAYIRQDGPGRDDFFGVWPADEAEMVGLKEARISFDQGDVEAGRLIPCTKGEALSRVEPETLAIEPPRAVPAGWKWTGELRVAERGEYYLEGAFGAGSQPSASQPRVAKRGTARWIYGNRYILERIEPPAEDPAPAIEPPQAVPARWQWTGEFRAPVATDKAFLDGDGKGVIEWRLEGLRPRDYEGGYPDSRRYILERMEPPAGPPGHTPCANEMCTTRDADGGCAISGNCVCYARPTKGRKTLEPQNTQENTMATQFLIPEGTSKKRFAWDYHVGHVVNGIGIVIGRGALFVLKRLVIPAGILGLAYWRVPETRPLIELGGRLAMRIVGL